MLLLYGDDRAVIIEKAYGYTQSSQQDAALVLLLAVLIAPIPCAGEEASFIYAPSHNAKTLDAQFGTLKRAGASGVMLDVW